MGPGQHGGKRYHACRLRASGSSLGILNSKERRSTHAFFRIRSFCRRTSSNRFRSSRLFEDLRTETRSGSGRALAATLSVPSKEFDTAIADLKTLGRTEAISEAGEDSAVKLATAERHLAGAQTNLSRLQKLQRERKGELRDAVALEKDIAHANETVAEAQRQHEILVSTVAQAHIRVTLIEDYRAPLETNLAGSSLALRNSFVEGVSAIFSSSALVLGVLFEFGLPLLFWAVVLFWPLRLVWRRFRHATANAAL